MPVYNDVSDTQIHRASDADRPVAERLWLMFRHEMSEFTGALPNPDGTFRSERLQSAFTGDPDWAAYLVMSGDAPVGLALVRSLSAPTRVLNSFFIVRAARQRGIGLRVVREIVTLHPGRWEVAFQDANVTAVRFWRGVARQLAPDSWTEERRLSPQRPDLPPDVWISFDTSVKAQCPSEAG